MRKSIFLFLIFFTACCPCRHLTTTFADSLRVEVRERIEWKMLPVDVAIPKEQQERTTQADSSYLETSIAASWAIVQSDGSLHHSLFNKPGIFRTSLNVPTFRKDSIVYRNMYREIVVEVAKPLTWWQQTQIKGFWVIVIAGVLWITARKVGNHFLRI